MARDHPPRAFGREQRGFWQAPADRVIRLTAMRRLKSIPKKMSVPIEADADGLLGRECPRADCEGYFKLEPGTGLKEAQKVHCPYCGHAATSDQFFTKEQIAYARSVVINKVTGALLGDLEDMARSFRAGFVTMSVRGEAHPIRYYREKELETDLVCTGCTLHYAVYGLFAFCPDCGAHNSRQILEKNLVLAEKELALAETVEPALAEHLIGDALENVVASFDGFGRQLCKVSASRATDPAHAASMSLQNLNGAQKNIHKLFGFDLASVITPGEWSTACRGFQKRHLLAHAMGVVDGAYLKVTNDPGAILGRKITITREEVRELVALIRRLADAASTALSPSPKQ